MSSSKNPNNGYSDKGPSMNTKAFVDAPSKKSGGETLPATEVKPAALKMVMTTEATTATVTATATATTVSTPSSCFNDIPLDTIHCYISPYLEIQHIFHLLLSTKYLYQTFTDCDCDGAGFMKSNKTFLGEVIDDRGGRGDEDFDDEDSVGETLLQDGEDVVEVFLKEEEVGKEEESHLKEECVQDKDINRNRNRNNNNSEINFKGNEVGINFDKEKEDGETQMKGAVEDIAAGSGMMGLSLADRFWKEKCQQRWKSVSFDQLSKTTPTLTSKTISRWYQGYKHRHLIDRDVKKKIQLIRKLDVLGQRKDQGGNGGENYDEVDNNDDNCEVSQSHNQYKYQKALLWSNLVQQGHSALDFVIEMARNEIKENEGNSMSNEKENNSESEAEPQQQPNSLLVEEILEGIHRFEICREFQTLSRLEQEGEQDIDSNEEDKDDDEVSDSSSQEHDESTSTADRSTVTLEYGAILIAKYYQTAHEIIHDYDVKHSNYDTDDKKVLSLEDYVDTQIEGMTNFIEKRLLERRAREELIGKKLSPTSFVWPPSSKVNKVNENRTNGQWPMYWILEEMKVLFQSPSQQRGNNGDEADNSSIGSTTSVSPTPPYSTSKSVDTRPFMGNEQNYYSHHNSLIQHILKSRKGIPISLSVLYAAVVRRVSGGVNMEAVGLPGHFMLSTKISGENQEQQQVFVDVFHGGAILTKQQCQILIVSRYNIPWDDAFIEPIRKTEVWSRMLRNLLNCHHRKIISSRSGIDMFFDNTEIGDSSLDADTKMMNAVRVLISLGFRLSRLPLDVCNYDKGFTEIVMMMSTLSQS